MGLTNLSAILEIAKNALSIIAILFPAAWALWLNLRSRWGYVSWRKITKGVALLHQKMIGSSYRPACIVCIGRGGAIAGSLLSEHFGPPLVPIVVLSFEYPKKMDSAGSETVFTLRNPQVIDFSTIRADMDNVLVLGIDIVSGETMKQAIEELAKKQVRVSGSACIFWNPDALVIPKYHVFESKIRTRFPWSQRTFREKVKAGG